MPTIKLIVSFFLLFFQLIAPIGNTALRAVTDTQFEKWSTKTKFTRDYCVELEKDPDKDFVILNLADLQMQDDEFTAAYGEATRATIDKLVEDLDPDLITLSGDNAWATMAYAWTVDYINSLGIPWAPVMGNHDGQGTIGEWWCAGLFNEADNCLWKNGPEDMGWGNYIINITENGHIVHTLFMMDTHSSAEYVLEDGTTVGGYDHLWDNQIEWYRWAVNGIAAIEGKTVESTVIYHIPNYEYNYALAEAFVPGTDEVKEGYEDTVFGVNHETICSAPVNNGFFDVVKELDSTKNIIVGHDHVNSSSIVYEGVRLSYSLKCGPACYWESKMSGGTTLTVDADGVGTVEHHYIDINDLEWGGDLLRNKVIYTD